MAGEELEMMKSKEQEEKRCPLMAFSQAAGGKYKMRILWELQGGPRRYGELRRSAVVAAQGTPVTARVLSRELKELHARGLIKRKQYGCASQGRVQPDSTWKKPGSGNQTDC